MTDQTDRIKQIAQEAGFPSMSVDNMSPQDVKRLAKFAALVAEDCARMAEQNWQRLKATERAHYAQTNQPFIPERFGFSSIDAEGYNIAQAIRARYALATPSQAG